MPRTRLSFRTEPDQTRYMGCVGAEQRRGGGGGEDKGCGGGGEEGEDKEGRDRPGGRDRPT